MQLSAREGLEPHPKLHELVRLVGCWLPDRRGRDDKVGVCGGQSDNLFPALFFNFKQDKEGNRRYHGAASTLTIPSPHEGVGGERGGEREGGVRGGGVRRGGIRNGEYASLGDRSNAYW